MQTRVVHRVLCTPSLIMVGLIFGASMTMLPEAKADTIGGGTITNPAVGPSPSIGSIIDTTGFVLVKNWKFGSSTANGSNTITSMADMNANFYYHDQFGTIANGTNYGAVIVSPDSANALTNQPIENVNTASPVRLFQDNSLKTFVVPLNGATTITPTAHNAGCGSFMAKWTLPNGGSLLGKDLIWETRVRYVTPPYFWFALWTSGSSWNQGAEMDTVESYGYDINGYTNYNGRYWHSDVVGGPSSYSTVDYSSWGTGMNACGVTSFDATQWHTWTWVYSADNSYSVYMDGYRVQCGTDYWTLGSTSGGNPLNMYFLFDAGWGHTQVASVNHSLDVSALAGTYYEWDYSRVYLRTPAAREIVVDNADTTGVTITGSWTASTYTTGYYGTNYIHDGNTGRGTKLVKFTPHLFTPGTYEVSARWTSDANRASNVPLDVVTASGTIPLEVNQQASGGAWISLGSYTFSSGTTGNVLLSNAGANGFVIADAIKFGLEVANPGFEADPSGSKFITGWLSSGSNPLAGYVGTSVAAHSGTSYLAHNSTSAYNVATYQTRTGLANGLYTLKAWVQRSGAQTTAQMEASGFGGTTVTAPIPVSSTWTQISITNINVTNTSCTLAFRSVAPSGAWIRVDDVEFFKQ